MAKHQLLEHRGEPPQFQFKVVSYHRSALSRQVKEAVRIKQRGGESNILNSRSEYNRCHITRLVVEEEDQRSKEEREKREKEELEEIIKGRQG